jgi:hypothetical protein
LSHRIPSGSAVGSANDATETLQSDVVKEMMKRGMLSLTGASNLRDAWATSSTLTTLLESK